LNQTEGRISSNLLNRKQSSRKTSIVCRWLKLLKLHQTIDIILQSNNNQSGFGRQRKKFVLLSVSHFTRVSTPIISISDPGLHVDAPNRKQNF